MTTSKIVMKSEKMVFYYKERKFLNYGVYFMIGSIDVVRGGMTRALLNRANILSEYYNEIGLITFDFNPDYDPIIEQFKEIGIWNEKIKHLNVFDFLMDETIKFRDSTAVDILSKNLSLLEHIDFFSDSEKFEKRELFDQMGRVRKISFFDIENNHAVNDLFLKPSGQCFLKNTYDPVEKKTLSCIWYNNNGEEIQTFSKVKDYRDYFINTLVDKHEASVLLSDGRFTDKILFANKNPKVAKVALIHSNHVSPPYEYGSTLNKRNAPLIENIQKVDAFVTLTERQAEDIKKRYGRLTTIHTVGHPSMTMKSKTKAKKERYTAAIVARYSGIKQIPHSIKAFKKVIQKVPQAKLEIWGFGSQEKEYKRLINSLSLENHVFVKGFTNDVSEVYQRAAFTVITSKSEAFAMTIVESMCEGTPVISYDCKYGPSDIIDHGKNGLIVECDNINALADAMIELFLNDNKWLAISEEARKITDKFGTDITAQKWMKVFEEAITQKDKRVQLKKITGELTKISYEKNTLLIEGNLCLQGIEVEVLPHVRENLNIGLQLRRRNELQDLYIPLQHEWVDLLNLQFRGEIAHFHEITKGIWDIHISIACLNSHKFIQIKICDQLALNDSKRKIAKTVLKLQREKQFLCINVSRSMKQKLDLKNLPRVLLQKYKAKIRDRLEGIG